MTLREQSPDKTRDQILEDALIKMALSGTANSTPAPARNADLFSDPAPVDKRPSEAPTLATSDRDQRIVELHRQGLSNYAVGAKAGCSEGTVRRVLKRISAIAD